MSDNGANQQEAPAVALAVITPDERLEYARRAGLANAKRLELEAAQAYLQAYGEQLRQLHELPDVFDLNLQTGEATARG